MFLEHLQTDIFEQCSVQYSRVNSNSVYNISVVVLFNVLCSNWTMRFEFVLCLFKHDFDDLLDDPR